MKMLAAYFFILLLPILAAGNRANAQDYYPSDHFVQFTAGDSGGATFDTTMFGKPVSPGNVILVLAHWNDQDVTATVEDSRGNKYVPLAPPMDSGPTERFQAWYAKDVKGGKDVAVTIHFSKKTRSFSVVDAMEYAGLEKGSPLIGAASNTGSGLAADSGALALADSRSCLLVGLFGYSNYALPYKPGPGFAMRAYEASTLIEDGDCSALPHAAATATSSNTASWAALSAAFRTSAH